MIGALLELQNCEESRRVELDCSRCPLKVQQMRRCREDKWDFGPQDADFWPMRVSKGGALYSFCPAKATWDSRCVAIYQALVIACECGTQWQEGAILDQPSWWIDLLSWFAPSYNEVRFYSRARSILGDGKEAPSGARKRNSRN